MSASNLSDHLPGIPGGWREEIVSTNNTPIRLMRPADPDLMLDDPATLTENQQNDYMPYWCWLWPAAIEMARVIHRIPMPADVPILEVGAGLGLVGIAGLQAGLDVVITDYRDEAVQVAKVNAKLNGFDPSVRQLDWREPVTRQFNCLFACDVLYEESNHEPILNFADQLLTSTGTAWLGDPGRQRATEFVGRAGQRFDVEIFDGNLNSTNEITLNQFNLLRLSRS